jgi:hypothetical protein
MASGLLQITLGEGGVRVGRGSECAIRLSDESIRPLHLRIHTEPLSSLAEHSEAAGGTFLRGRRVRLTLLLPWAGCKRLIGPLAPRSARARRAQTSLLRPFAAEPDPLSCFFAWDGTQCVSAANRTRSH